MSHTVAANHCLFVPVDALTLSPIVCRVLCIHIRICMYVYIYVCKERYRRNLKWQGGVLNRCGWQSISDGQAGHLIQNFGCYIGNDESNWGSIHARAHTHIHTRARAQSFVTLLRSDFRIWHFLSGRRILWFSSLNLIHTLYLWHQLSHCLHPLLLLFWFWK